MTDRAKILHVGWVTAIGSEVFIHGWSFDCENFDGDLSSTDENGAVVVAGWPVDALRAISEEHHVKAPAPALPPSRTLMASARRRPPRSERSGLRGYPGDVENRSNYDDIRKKIGCACENFADPSNVEIRRGIQHFARHARGEL